MVIYFLLKKIRVHPAAPVFRLRPGNKKPEKPYKLSRQRTAFAQNAMKDGGEKGGQERDDVKAVADLLLGKRKVVAGIDADVEENAEHGNEGRKEKSDRKRP